MMREIVGLMQRTGGTVSMIETTTGTIVTLEEGQRGKMTWIGTGTALSSNIAGTQE
jgi:hypothetical protein